jgi:hypothetical protein
VTPQEPKTQVVRDPGTTTDGTTTATVPAPATIVSQAPDTQTLVTAANLYPQLILSDEVAAMSPTPAGCTIDAAGIFSSTNTFGVFKASPVPVLKIVSTCDTRRGVVGASQGRVKAFKKWIVAQQNAAQIPRKQRIIISELQAPVSATTVSSSNAALPVFVGLVIFFAFCLLALRLGRPGPEPPSPPRQEPSPSQTRV